MKKHLSLGLIFGLLIGLLLSSTAVMATTPIKLVVNGVDITYKSDVPPQIIEGRTLIPARALAEALGATVTWDGQNSAVIVTSVDKPVIVDSLKTVEIEPKPQPIEDQPPAEKIYKIGDLIDLGDTQIKILSTTYSQTHHEFIAGNNETFFLVDFEVITTQKPSSNRYHYSLMFIPKATTDDGINYTTPGAAGRDVYQVYPGKKATCTISFTIDKKDTIKYLTVSNGTPSKDIVVKLN